MSITCSAVYEQGVLRPVQPLELPEGTEVEVTVVPKPSSQPLAGKELYDAIMSIAALPIEGKTDPFSGRDHDQVLYGGKEQP